MEYHINAEGKSLGRVATEAASVLLGKNTTTVKKNAVAEVTVRISNAGLIAVSDKKMRQKLYHTHSGYLGNQRTLTLRQVVEKKGHGEAIARAVKGMLPGNTLRVKRMKHLVIED